MTSFKFEKREQLTIGVEIELQILDPDSFALAPQSETLLKKCRERGLERVKTEIHQSMLEVDSEISATTKECKAFLKNRLIGLSEIAEDLGLRIGVTGTHPFQQWKDRLISKNNRFEFLHKKFQWLVRRMNVYGLHVHIGMPSGDRALAISQAMVRYLPHLLALSGNSPFWQEIDTGMCSSRISIIESFPFAGTPPNFGDWEQFEYYYKTLHQSGAISSLKDLYWYIRPNLSFGTIEFRICDAMSTLSETMALVALIHCLVATISEQFNASPSQRTDPEHLWIAPHNQWIAARDGLDGIIILDLKGTNRKISDEILELVEKLLPMAKKLDCAEELEFLKTIILRGNGAERQREVFSKANSLEDVVSSAIQELDDDLKNPLTSSP